MIELATAYQIVAQHSQPLAADGTVDLWASLDRVLGRKIVSRFDIPPAAKALMDGYAVHAADLTFPAQRLQLCERVAAGQCPTRPLPRGYTTQVMTGAPLPDGADAVVMREKTSDRPDDGHIDFHVHEINPGINVGAAGSSIQRGETIFHAGRRLSAIDVGVLAELGVARVDVVARPTVAVLSTGSELVDVKGRPKPGQIYNSNGPLLCALLRRWGLQPLDLGIGPDEPDALSQLIRQGLQADILLLTGGVSAGDWDLVPGLLAQLGVRQLFHRVRLKPGKPIWFGCQSEGRDDGERLVGDGTEGAPPPPSRLVFGLPGNPVSTLACFHLFVLPALRRLAGEAWVSPEQAMQTALLDGPWRRTCDRPTFWPAALSNRDGRIMLKPLTWHGSYDLRALAAADGLLSLDVGHHALDDAAPVRYLPLAR